MRPWVVVIGSVLLLVGLAAVFGGAFLADLGDACVNVRECGADGELVMWGAFGQGIAAAGWLLGLAGIGLAIAGILADRAIAGRPSSSA